MSNVNHPSHYNSHPAGVECIDVIEHMSFNVGNAIKYLWRADLKGAPVEDLEKAAWYIAREIERKKRDTIKEQPKIIETPVTEGGACPACGSRKTYLPKKTDLALKCADCNFCYVPGL